VNAIVLALAVATALSWALAGLVRRIAPLDLPNERSSHVRATPRGGGLAIAVVVLAGIVLLAAIGDIPARMALGLVGGGLAVAAVGWLDDKRGLGTVPRALVQLLAAAWTVTWIGLPSALGSGALGIALAVVAVVAIAWCCNLYNFMDGIDGIAGSEAVIVGFAGGWLLWRAGAPDLALASLLIGAASAGFLVWNWPPARLFMGDVGSGLLGFLFGAIAVASVERGAVPLPSWLLLLGVFFFDATATLLRRMIAGERWYAAHRSHAYQRAVQSGLSHRAVTLATVAINLVLAALAALAALIPGASWPAFGAGFVLLAICYALAERRRPMYPRAADGAAVGRR
jgi:Fuc2NAc and GlcNAc transferase